MSGKVSFDENVTPLPVNLRQAEVPRINFAQRNCPTPIYETETLIRKVLIDQPESSVSWSGGKCSTCILHMALQINPDMPVNFIDTGVEFPETYEFVDYIIDEWSVNLTRLKPKTTFWKCVEKWGFPMLRGKYDKRTSLSKDGRPMCCQLLKEAPLLEAGIPSTITGLRVAESRMRTFGIAQRGQFYYAKTLKRWNWHPIAFWTEEQVWKYHHDHQLPHNKIYNMGHFRCGCWPCTGYLYWQKYLSVSHPAMYKALMKKKGTPTLWEYDEGGCPLVEVEE